MLLKQAFIIKYFGSGRKVRFDWILRDRFKSSKRLKKHWRQ